MGSERGGEGGAAAPAGGAFDLGHDHRGGMRLLGQAPGTVATPGLQGVDDTLCKAARKMLRDLAEREVGEAETIIGDAMQRFRQLGRLGSIDQLKVGEIYARRAGSTYRELARLSNDTLCDHMAEVWTRRADVAQQLMDEALRVRTATLLGEEAEEIEIEEEPGVGPTVEEVSTEVRLAGELEAMMEEATRLNRMGAAVAKEAGKRPLAAAVASAALGIG